MYYTVSMKENSLIGVSVKVVEGARDALYDFLLTLSPGGVVEESKGEGEEWLEGCASIYLEKGEAEEKLKTLEEYLSALTDIWGEDTVILYEVEEVGNDWRDKYQRFFTAKRVTNRIVVSPPWEDYLGREGDIVIKILPGAAFGTGTHETTRLSLIAMGKVFSTAKIDSILDVGTGSGILAVAGALLGAGRVLGVESDAEAVKSAVDNVIRNEVHDTVEIRHGSFGEGGGIEPDSLRERFDLVVANITGEVIRRVAASLSAFTNPNGYLILSGFLTGEEDEIVKAFGDTRKLSVSMESMGEWSSIIVKRGKQKP